MPTEVLATIVGVAITAFIGAVVYFYRSTITFEITSISEDLAVDGDKIRKSDAWNAIKLTLERITFKNVGLVDLEAVKLHVDRTPELLSSRVNDTTSLSKAAVELTSVGDQLEVRIPHFPRSEEISIEISYLSHGGGPLRDVKGAGGRYKVQKKSYREAIFSGVRNALVPLGIFFLVLILLQVSGLNG